MNVKNLILGFDIGTSSIKLVLYNDQTNQTEFELSRSTAKARINQLSNPSFDEQDVDVIVDLLKDIFAEINDDFYKRLKAVRLCGQMHGIVLWNRVNHKHSHLVTWQDARCSKDFLENLPVKSKNGLHSGYGCATLFWYVLNGYKNFIEQFDSSGTIHDYISYL
jgi:sedoheptulokinase